MNSLVPMHRSPSFAHAILFLLTSRCPWPRRHTILGSTFLLTVCNVLVASAANQPTIQGIQTISSVGATRVVISLSAPIRYELIPEHTSKTSATPSRLHIRFSPAHIAPGVRTAATVDDGILKEVRTGLLADSIVRVSLVLDQLGTYRATTYRSPDQVVIQLRRQAENRVSARSLPLPRTASALVRESSQHRSTLPLSSAPPSWNEQQRASTQSPIVTTQSKEPTGHRVILPPPILASPPPIRASQTGKPWQQDSEREAQQSLSEKEATASLEPSSSSIEQGQQASSDTVRSAAPTISNPERAVAPAPALPTPLQEPNERHAALTLPRPAPTPPSLQNQEQSVEPTIDGERYRIVIDPGHGGSDPGAIGVNGLQEKRVVLAVSKQLAQKLRKRLGADVILTRTTDVFIPLPERTARANAATADLFISIHANASPNSDTQGVETYYLNNTNDRATIRLAKLENGIRTKLQLPHREASLSFILSDLIQTGKEEESIALAEAVQTALIDQARTTISSARDLGVKQGPFYVLVGAHMPCILVELAFLTHPEEGQRLGLSSYQETLAEGLYLGIADFLRTGLSAKNL